jgi:type 2 lantibiotic biosynthesis protein LanM
VDASYERLILRAATIDELLSDEFEALPGQKGDADLAARRLAAWCQSCASGDWALFGRRLERDRLSLAQVLERFATACRKTSASPPGWIEDAIWIEAALQRPAKAAFAGLGQTGPYAFEEFFTPLVEHAETLLWSGIDARVIANLNESARACLRRSLLRELSNLCSPAIYERFDKARKAGATPEPGRGACTSHYDQFVAAMKADGFRDLFVAKPVLLRLMATIARQWIDTSREFARRLDADLAMVRRDILHSKAPSRVAKIEGDLSDPHNGGHSVQIISFEDGARIVYKPKDLRLDAAWHALIGRLNLAAPPLELKAVRAIARDGYGWTEFIDHAAGTDRDGCKRYFRRAGAWLALFHCFAATDMHQENMIAAGEHPVPIDLETILQAPADEHKVQDSEGQAFNAAIEIVGNSVMVVGLLPAYGRSADNNVFAIGGMNAEWNSKTKIKWTNINADEMRPTRSVETGALTNLPHIDGRYASFADHIGDFIAGFEDYAKFLLRQSSGARPAALFDGFDGLPVRKVIHPTRFYYMLLRRLKNHQAMDDGVIWSAQADFVARLAEWDQDSDPVWPLRRAERDALLALNVPHFVSPSDGKEIRDAAGISILTQASSGLDRARDRVENFDAQDIAWQIEVIRENANSVLKSPGSMAIEIDSKDPRRPDVAAAPPKQIFIAEADRIAKELSHHAIRGGSSAAWIGLDWLGDSEAFQLVCLGPELYNGTSGIALFLAAHAAVTGYGPSGELALAGISYLRKTLRNRNAARMARSVGIGGAIGLGSIVYALTVMSKCLHDDDLLADAQSAAALFTDELIAADKRLDVIGGSAGAILGLLRLYRDTQSLEVLGRATKCGEHLIGQSRLGADGRRFWVGQGSGQQGLNGMSHGAAGFAYALAALSAATEREDFAQAAAECIAFENSSYDVERNNWPDRRNSGEPAWPCRWCHGAPGIGLARIGMAKRGAMEATLLQTDVRNAVAGVERGWRGQLDTLCCGSLGSIEFFCEAGGALGRDDLRELAAQRLAAIIERAAATGDYRWNSGKGKFNLGLFRGLAGVGYTLLRQVDGSLPNVLIWE